MFIKKFSAIFFALAFVQSTLVAAPQEDIDAATSPESNTLVRGFGINFHRGMRTCPSYTAQATLTDADWHLIKFMYDKYITDFDEVEHTTRIPHIIHQICLTDDELPEIYKKFQQSWIRQHPQWHYKLWTVQDIASLDLINKAEYEAATSIEEKAAIASCEILYRYGGVFVALDCECLKPFDILHRACDFYAGIAPASHVLISDSIIGASPFNPMIGICIEALRRLSFKEDIFSSEHFCSALTTAYKRLVLFSSDRAIILPLSYLNPWPLTEDNMPDITRRRFSTNMSFAMKHWFVKNSPKDTDIIQRD